MSAERCQVNVAERDEDVGFRIAYVECGRRASWYSEDARVHPDGLHLCEDHKRELELRVEDDVVFDEVVERRREVREEISDELRGEAHAAWAGASR